MTSKPLVFGIITLLNAQQFIQAAIKNVFGHIYQQCELCTCGVLVRHQALEKGWDKYRQHPASGYFLAGSTRKSGLPDYFS